MEEPEKAEGTLGMLKWVERWVFLLYWIDKVYRKQLKPMASFGVWLMHPNRPLIHLCGQRELKYNLLG